MSTRIILHQCPLTQITIQKKCPVADCLYHSKANKTGCIARDAEELSLEELSVHKGIDNSLSTICTNRKRSVESIKTVLIVDEFLVWLDNKLEPGQYPYVTGYHNRALQHAVTTLASQVAILNVAELNWNIGKVCCALQESYWREFEKERKLKEHNHLELLGIKAAVAKQILSQYAQAAFGQKGNEPA